jgi:hypothetical protein
MTSNVLIAAFTAVFVIGCVAQVGRSHDAYVAGGLWHIHHVLQGAHVSGSLAYSGCGFDKRVPPDLPPFGVWVDSGTPEEILSKLFSADPLMHVTREGRMIRMMEVNVPTDLLNLKIHHVSFFSPTTSDSDPVHGPRMALLAILESPEVVAFGKEQNIRGLPSPEKSVMLPGDCCGKGRIVQGKLDDVTVSQALDYVLQTFPGYWIYENCLTEDGDRSVYFNFE